MAEPVRVCAYCRERPVEAAWRPFCSERCKMADLGRWFSGDYRIPGAPVPTAEDDDAEDAE
jgi:endogenous inhibitor of DNA gyrase (YacG/DUF329 family)